MNTPRTKKPKRWKHSLSKIPDGGYEMGLDNNDYCLLIGTIATYWPQIEELMIDIMRELLGLPVGATPVRQLYRSIINAQTRITIMKNLLEKSPSNASREEAYDEIIDEFDSLNDLRNKYVHGLWSVRQDNKEVYLAEYSLDDLWLMKSRKVELNELQDLLKRMYAFFRKVITMRRNISIAHALSLSAQISPPLHVENSQSVPPADHKRGEE